MNRILNCHIGDLPRYRGNATPNWAIINSEDKITLSIYFIEPHVIDAGRIVAQSELSITEDTTIAEVYTWLEEQTPITLVAALGRLQRDPKSTLKYANPNSEESFRCYPRRPEDDLIDWHQSVKNTHNLIRA